MFFKTLIFHKKVDFSSDALSPQREHRFWGSGSISDPPGSSQNPSKGSQQGPENASKNTSKKQEKNRKVRKPKRLANVVNSSKFFKSLSKKQEKTLRKNIKKTPILGAKASLLTSKKASKTTTFSKVKIVEILHTYHAFVDLAPPRIEKKTLQKVYENLRKLTAKKVIKNLQKRAIFALKNSPLGGRKWSLFVSRGALGHPGARLGAWEGPKASKPSQPP